MACKGGTSQNARARGERGIAGRSPRENKDERTVFAPLSAFFTHLSVLSKTLDL